MSRNGHSVLGTFIDAIAWDEAISIISGWAEKRQSRYVCLCNVHSVITASRNQSFRLTINSADMATPDGTPVAWALRHLGFPSQARISGPDLMWKYLFHAEQNEQRVFFYGSTMETLEKLRVAVTRDFPRLDIAGMHAPPFRPSTMEEDEAEVEMINGSGAHLVFVGLGCPKQEQWMAAHRGRINAVMVGVGAAFDFHSGVKKRAPLWWQRHGLEWLYRLGTEPRRLFRRYMVTNTLFVVGLSRQLWRRKMLGK